MNSYYTIAHSGLNLPVIALTLERVALGTFFAISGYHKLFNRERHAHLAATLAADRIPLLSFNQWFVPSIEFLGGLALFAGLLAPLAALGLMFICIVATCTDAVPSIPKRWKPIDKADYVDDLLYLPEVLYVIMLATVIFAGSGPLSLDAVVLKWWGLG